MKPILITQVQQLVTLVFRINDLCPTRYFVHLDLRENMVCLGIYNHGTFDNTIVYLDNKHAAEELYKLYIKLNNRYEEFKGEINIGE